MDLRESAGVICLIKWNGMITGCVSFSRSWDYLFIITGGKAECVEIGPCRWVEGTHMGTFF